ncbi:MAG: tyrosine-type recombinase/integrase [Acidobacteriota bacterium]
MARRRFQNPKPKIVGNFWSVLVRENTPGAARKRVRIQLAPATMPEREVLKVLAERLRPVNQGVITAGSAVNFMHFVEDTYEKTVLPLLASSVQPTYRGAIRKHLKPVFASYALRDMTPVALQAYFSGLHKKSVSYPTIVKVRDALSSVLRAAVEYEYLQKNPLESLKLPPDKRGKQAKPWITPQQFFQMLDLISEPYATIVYTAVFTGLRVSELAALKWRCIHKDSITIEQRFCRGDWSCTKSDASAATIAVGEKLVERIQRLKELTVSIRAGRALRQCKVVKQDGPDHLVFPSVYKGKPLNDGNILRRHIKPAAALLKLKKVSWHVLRRSYGTWMVQAGADPKSVQGQMRHSRIGTTMDIYAQFVPEGQRKAVNQLATYVEENVPNVPLVFQ